LATKALPIATLHEHHYGVDETLSATYARAALVCLERHHKPPVSVQVSADTVGTDQYQVDWEPLKKRAKTAYGNPVDASHLGAYGLVLAALEAHLNMVTVDRAPIGSGSDCYVQPLGTDTNPDDGKLDMEQAMRLEVSGIDCDSAAAFNAHVRRKVAQVHNGSSIYPGMAGVAGYKLLKIVFKVD
jgi:hypothetical protein